MERSQRRRVMVPDTPLQPRRRWQARRTAPPVQQCQDLCGRPVGEASGTTVQCRNRRQMLWLQRGDARRCAQRRVAGQEEEVPSALRERVSHCDALGAVINYAGKQGVGGRAPVPLQARKPPVPPAWRSRTLARQEPEAAPTPPISRRRDHNRGTDSPAGSGSAGRHRMGCRCRCCRGSRMRHRCSAQRDTSAYTGRAWVDGGRRC